MANVAVGDCILGDNDLESALRRICRREPDAPIDEGAGQDQRLDLQRAQLFLETRPQKGAVRGLADQPGGSRQM